MKKRNLTRGCAVLLTLTMLALAGCGSSASSEPAAQDQEQVLTDDADYFTVSVQSVYC